MIGPAVIRIPIPWVALIAAEAVGWVVTGYWPAWQALLACAGFASACSAALFLDAIRMTWERSLAEYRSFDAGRIYEAATHDGRPWVVFGSATPNRPDIRRMPGSTADHDRGHRPTAVTLPPPTPLRVPQGPGSVGGLRPDAGPSNVSVLTPGTPGSPAWQDPQHQRSYRLRRGDGPEGRHRRDRG